MSGTCLQEERERSKVWAKFTGSGRSGSVNREKMENASVCLLQQVVGWYRILILESL